MGIASIALALSIIPSSTFILIFPNYQITFAQGNAIQSADPSSSFNTLIAGISGGLIAAGATLFGTYINNRYNMNVKKQELKHGLDIELLKYRIDCYSLIIKYITTNITGITTADLSFHKIGEFMARLNVWSNEEKGALLMSENSLRLFNDFWQVLITVSNEAKKEAGGPSVYSYSESQIHRIEEGEWNFRISLLRDIGVHGKIPKS
jgi:hypothetical protein